MSGKAEQGQAKESIVNHERASVIISEIEGIFEREGLDLVEEKLIFDLLQGRHKGKISRQRADNFTTDQLNKLGIGKLFGKLR
jgi:hypothetical protein